MILETQDRPCVIDASVLGLSSAADAVAQPAELLAYCGPDGVIHFGTEVPQWSIELVRGDSTEVRDRLQIVARRGWTPGVLLVPGLPEANDQAEARAALAAWLKWCDRCERHHDPKLVWNVHARVSLSSPKPSPLCITNPADIEAAFAADFEAEGAPGAAQ